MGMPIPYGQGETTPLLVTTQYACCLVYFVVVVIVVVALLSNADNDLTLEVSGSHKTTHYSQYNSPGRVISSSQRPLADNTQETSMLPAVFRPTIPATERLPTYTLDSAAKGSVN
jgi:hypothetical protein